MALSNSYTNEKKGIDVIFDFEKKAKNMNLPDAEDLDDKGRISKDAYDVEDIIEHNGKQYIRSNCNLRDSDLTLFTYVKIEENKQLHYSYMKY